MRRALGHSAVVPIGWGLWLGGLTAIQVAFNPQPFVKWFLAGLLGGASAAALLYGLGLLARDLTRRRAAPTLAALAESSAATTALIAGLALALLGANFGLWAAFIGGGVMLAGAGGLVREDRARRRALSRWRAQKGRERIAAHERGAATLAADRPGPGRRARTGRDVA